MEKNPDKNETGEAGEPGAHDVVFNGDALVVDYLTTLLTSSPAKSLDSGEINMIHLAIEAGWKLVGEPGGTAHSPQNFEADLAKLEAETLKNENKHLKFKTELAAIDAQVLRGENNNLKTEITDLKARILQIQGMLETLVAENTQLRSLNEVLQNRPAPPDELPEEAPSDRTAPVQEPEAVAEEEETEAAEAVASPAGMNEMPDEEEPAPATAELTAAEEPAPDTPAPAPAAPTLTNVEASFAAAEERAFFAQIHNVPDTMPLKSERPAVLTSRPPVSVAAPAQHFRPASKVIKQHDSTHYQSRPEKPAPVAAVPSPPPVQPPTPLLEPETLTEAMPQEPVREQPDMAAGESPALQEDVLHQDSTAELDMPAAPAPKVVIRRTVMNYEELQKEADSSHAPATGHRVIL